MKVLVTGAAGQLGRELVAHAPSDVTLVPLTRGELDITDGARLREVMRAQAPELVLNAAAYTNVDRAEDEREAAQQVNGTAVGVLAECCAEGGARLIHVSTDYVFDGARAGPYPVDAPVAPVNAYGESKLQGERAALQASGGAALVVRTSWVYSRHGTNFVLKMLALARTREELGVVVDQVGTPTWAGSLAQALWQFAARPQLRGIYHWTDAGVASWYDFAVAVFEEAAPLGMLGRPVRVTPLQSADFPTRARRPLNSTLDKSRSWADLGGVAPHWRVALRGMLTDLKRHGTA